MRHATWLLVAITWGACARKDLAAGEWNRGMGGASGATVDGGPGGTAGLAGAGTAVSPCPDGSPNLSLLAGTIGGKGTLDGPAAVARTWQVRGMLAEPEGNLYFVDGSAIRVLDPGTGTVSTLAGSVLESGRVDGPGSAARFDTVSQLVSDGAGNLVVYDAGWKMLRKIVAASGEVRPVNMQSLGEVDALYASLASDGAGQIFLGTNGTILKIDLATGQVQAVAGALGEPGNTDGVGADARLDPVGNMVCNGDGNLYFSNQTSIRKLVIATGQVTTLAGSNDYVPDQDGSGTAVRLQTSSLTDDGAGGLFFLSPASQSLRRLMVATGEVSTLPVKLSASWASSLTSDRRGNLFLLDGDVIERLVLATGVLTPLVNSVGAAGAADGIGAAARFSAPSGVTTDGAGNLFVVDSDTAAVRRVVVATGQVTTIESAAGWFLEPSGTVVDGTGNLFVIDKFGQLIRKIVIATGEVSTLAGSPQQAGLVDGVGFAARFALTSYEDSAGPRGLASDGKGRLFVADTGNRAIRRIDIATRSVTTLAGWPDNEIQSIDGQGRGASFTRPVGIISDGASTLYVTDGLLIRRVAVDTGQVTTVASLGAMPDSATPDVSDTITGLTLDRAGQLLVADHGMIRKVDPGTGTITTVLGSASQAGVSLGCSATLTQPSSLVTLPDGRIVVVDENAVLLLTL